MTRRTWSTALLAVAAVTLSAWFTSPGGGWPGAPWAAQDATATAEATLPPVFLPFLRRDATPTPQPTPTLTSTPVPPTARPATATNTARPPTAEPTRRPCCRCCTRGVSKPCGDSCISQSRNCNTPPGCACFCAYDPLLGEEVCETDDSP